MARKGGEGAQGCNRGAPMTWDGSHRRHDMHVPVNQPKTDIGSLILALGRGRESPAWIAMWLAGGEGLITLTAGRGREISHIWVH